LLIGGIASRTDFRAGAALGVGFQHFGHAEIDRDNSLIPLTTNQVQGL